MPQSKKNTDKPVSPLKKQHTETVEAPAAGRKPVKLFITEDYHLTRLGLVAVLQQYPQIDSIAEAESAEEALPKIKADPPDVLLLDLGLPGMNGIEMATLVKQTWPAIKIIILTSHQEGQEVIAALGAGANAYVLKDIKPDRLIQVIETVYDGAIWLDPAIASAILTLTTQEKTATKSNEKPASDTTTVTDLTDREIEVLQLIVNGKSNPEIAEALCISIHTAKAHVGNILNKLCVSDRVQAAIKALKENII
ncbi:MAG: response regulator transcription factor [Cyanobacteria bacterium P01_H01_bin.74]